MPLRHRTLVSSHLTRSSRRDSSSLPVYYGSTRLEYVGPYCMASEPVRDLMKTIDLRGGASIDSTFMLPGIAEEDEIELDEFEPEIGAKTQDMQAKSTHEDCENDEVGSREKKRLGSLASLCR